MKKEKLPDVYLVLGPYADFNDSSFWDGATVWSGKPCYVQFLNWLLTAFMKEFLYSVLQRHFEKSS